MKGCGFTRKNLGAFLTDELTPEERNKVISHLKQCSSCQQELTVYQQLLQAVDDFAAGLRREEDFIDWELLVQKVRHQVRNRQFQRERKPRSKPFFQQSGWRSWLSRPLWAGLSVGVIIGALAMLLILKGWLPRISQEEVFSFSPQMLDQVEQHLAREEVRDYLDKSQLLLLEFLQLPSDQAQRFWQEKMTAEEIQELLLKKKYLNSQLADFRLARVKALCDQIEFLIYELLKVSEGLPSEEIIKLQRFIQEKQLLLKINIIRKELDESEV
ncbi:MAG: hypothetical protein DRJ11_02835 [Candidatus Aminicenantes bacterium]|nr:MAG: hypothetical protein DRJ11_02835 [Candidatus Aminicenantes bacterium]